MSIFINNKKILGTEPSVNPGDLGLFAGVDDQFYVKKSDGTIYPIGSSSSTATQSYIMNIADLSSLIDYSLNGNGTYSDFTYAKVLQFPTIINSVDFLSDAISTASTVTASVYNGTALFDITGGNNLVDVTSISFRIMEGSDASNDIDYYYRIDFNTLWFAQSYEFYQMATHSTYQYAHYFKNTEINGDVGGSIELSFDGVTVDLVFSTNFLFTKNLP